MTPDPRVQKEPVIGWRVWWLRAHTGHQLSSYSAPYEWTPGRNQAHCGQPVHRCTEAPGSNCACGFWGLWDWRQAALMGEITPAGTVRMPPGVIGLIAGWGQVAIHGDEGFRAQYARVVCLFTDHIEVLNQFKPPRMRAPHRGELVRTAASQYQVPALPLHVAAQRGMLAEFGVPAPAIRDIALHVSPPSPERKPDRLGDRYRQWRQSGPEMLP